MEVQNQAILELLKLDISKQDVEKTTIVEELHEPSPYFDIPHSKLPFSEQSSSNTQQQASTVKEL
jgi:hypothetical protein